MNSKVLIGLSVLFVLLGQISFADSDISKILSGKYISTSSDGCTATVYQNTTKNVTYFEFNQEVTDPAAAPGDSPAEENGTLTLNRTTGSVTDLGLCLDEDLKYSVTTQSKDLGNKIQYTYSCGGATKCIDVKLTLVVDKASGSLLSVDYKNQVASISTISGCVPLPKQIADNVSCKGLQWHGASDQ